MAFTWPRQALALLLLASGAAAPAQPRVIAELGYEAEATDNIRRASSNTREDLIHRPFLAVGYSQQFSRVDLSADYRAEARRYQRGSYSGDEVFFGASAVNVSLLPGRLTWLTDHVRSETLLDRRDADRPDNRRESDTLGTGLTYLLGAASANQLTTSVRAELFNSNRGFDDSTRYSGTLDYRRRVSAVQGVGLRGSVLAVDYDLDRVPDYDRWSLLATFDRELRNAGVDFGVGYNEVARSGMPSRGGLALTANGYLEPTAGHRFSVSAQREFTDRSLEGGRGIPEFGDELDEVGAEGNVFELTRIGLGYSYSRERWTFGADLSAVEEDYDLVLRDSRRLVGQLRAGYRITPGVTMDASLRVQRRKFTDENRQDDLYALNVRWLWQVVERTSLSLAVGYEERDSDAGGRSYDERRVVLTVRHRLW
ncbi:MAG: outer membrane beta-barrel protein [Gammaproteobacteria bacterium]|nr:outer membrane beta-barrel protein [Gammaproteobacteria bacterium]